MGDLWFRRHVRKLLSEIGVVARKGEPFGSVRISGDHIDAIACFD